MKSLVFACCAVLGYSIFNLFVEKYLTKIHPLVTTAFCSLGMAAISMSTLATTRSLMRTDSLFLPQGREWLIILGLGCFIAIAEFFYFSAYTSGGNIIQITTLVALVPLVTAVLKYIVDGQKTSLLMLTACIMAIGAVILSIIAQQQTTPHPPP